MKDLSYMSPVITELAAYFRCGHSIKELQENLDYKSPEEIYSSPEMLMHDIDCISKHLRCSSNTTSNSSVITATINNSGYVNCGNNTPNIFGVNYDEIEDDELVEYMKLIESNLINKITSISSSNQQEIKEFLKTLADFSKNFNSNLSDDDVEQLKKFREIMKKCDYVVRETTKNSPIPSSIDSLESFDVYTNQANEAWIQAENCKMFSATGMFINPITKINELYNENNKLTDEISKLKSQLADKEKEISDLKKKKPVVNNK